MPPTLPTIYLPFPTYAKRPASISAGWRLVSNWRSYILFVLTSLTVLASFIKTYQPAQAVAKKPHFNRLTELSPRFGFYETRSAVAEPIPTAHLPETKKTPGPIVTASSGIKSGGYAYGQCTYYVAMRRYVPPSWGDARNWYYRAPSSGYKVGSTPAAHAIAWTTRGPAGHVAYVEQASGTAVLIAEMNFKGWNKVDQRWVPASDFKYIY